MGYYWVYYLAVLLAYWGLDHPAVLGGLIVFFALSRWIPDPWVFLRGIHRTRALSAQIRANPANVTARRDLARLYLDQLRPGAALELLNEALTRDPHSPELLHLQGVALYRRNRPEEAIDALVDAVAHDPKVSFGAPYLVAGDALRELGRHEEAIDAYERFLRHNSSSIQGWTKLALAHRSAKEPKEAEVALREATATWQQIPWYARRKQVGWFLRAQVHRLGL